MRGASIKDFMLVERLGQGSMGEVWLAEQQLIKTRVAIKFLSDEVSRDSPQVKRFFNEAIAVSKIQHAGTVKIFDVGFHGARAYMIMELLQGETLAQRIARSGRLPLSQVADLGQQIANILETTHNVGITHRDLKPDNIFIVPDGERASRQRIKILDFGIAKIGGAESQTASSSSMGTPAYMSPELWKDAASADPRSDIYALGCVTFEMCTGRPPFLANSIGEACTRHLTEAPPHVRSLAPMVPEDIDDLLVRMLAKQAGQRPALAEISAAFGRLATLASGLDATIAPNDAHRDALSGTTLQGAAQAIEQRSSGGKKGLVVAIALVALAAIGITVAVVASSGSTGSTSEAPPPPKTALVEPKRGLEVAEHYRDPRADWVADLKSETVWLTARDDFDAACKQVGGLARWCAGRELADGLVDVIAERMPQAIAKLRAATTKDADWVVPHIALSAALANTGDIEGALAAARAAQLRDPKSWHAIAVGARALAASDRIDDAIVEYRRAIALAPDNAYLMAEVALAYHAAGMDAEADRIGGAVFAKNRELASLRLVRAERALEEGKGVLALTEAESLLAFSPKNIAGHVARGDALVLLDRKDDARTAYRRAIDLAAKNPKAPKLERLEVVKMALEKNELPIARKPGSGRTKPDPGSKRPTRTRPGCGKEATCTDLLE